MNCMTNKNRLIDDYAQYITFKSVHFLAIKMPQ